MTLGADLLTASLIYAGTDLYSKKSIVAVAGKPFFNIKKLHNVRRAEFRMLSDDHK